MVIVYRWNFDAESTNFNPSPGLNLTYAHASSLVARHAKDGDDVQMLYVTGPGHGAPAVLACLYLEGSITRFYPQVQTTLLLSVFDLT